jgi:two-component system response regulator DevR
MESLKVLIVDDHEVVRVGLRTLLSRFPQIEIVGEAGTVTGAISETERLRPDVVLLDVRLTDGSGFTACRQIQKMPDGPGVLILTSFADDDVVFESIAAGADGYLLKEIDADGLVRAIEKVAAGQSILDPAVTGRVMGRMKNLAEPVQHRINLLSAQERRVLALVAEGKTNKEVGLALGLSEKTIKNYFSNVLDKLELSRRSQAVAYFVQHTIGR